MFLRRFLTLHETHSMYENRNEGYIARFIINKILYMRPDEGWPDVKFKVRLHRPAVILKDGGMK